MLPKITWRCHLLEGSTARSLLDAGELFGIKLVVGKFGGQARQQGTGGGLIFVAQRCHGEQQAGKRREVISLFGGETQTLDAFVLVSLRSGYTQHPADGCGSRAQEVILHTDREKGIVATGIDRE